MYADIVIYSKKQSSISSIILGKYNRYLYVTYLVLTKIRNRHVIPEEVLFGIELRIPSAITAFLGLNLFFIAPT